MAGSASVPRCQGFTFAQPALARQPATSASRRRMQLFTGVSLEEQLDLFHVFLLGLGPAKTAVGEADFAVTVEDE